MKKLPHPEDEEAWLMTYADMITLLLCFFAIMLSVSEPKQSKFEEIKQAVQSGFSKEVASTPFSDILDSFQAIVEQNQMEKAIAIEESPKGVVLEFSTASFYEPGSAEFKPEALPVLDQVAQALAAFEYENYKIEVEGHTDDVPIATALYPSNWELSANRAARVVRYFIEKGVDKSRLRASGYADTFPKVPNLDAEGNPIPENRDLNRRVVVRLERN